MLHCLARAVHADVEAGVDWWLDAFLPTGAMPPQHLQLVISAAYDAAEQQDSSATAAEAVLASVPEAEADVIRAQLSRVKLSGEAEGGAWAAHPACVVWGCERCLLPLDQLALAGFSPCP